jgi:hypothetical protein
MKEEEEEEIKEVSKEDSKARRRRRNEVQKFKISEDEEGCKEAEEERSPRMSKSYGYAIPLQN